MPAFGAMNARLETPGAEVNAGLVLRTRTRWPGPVVKGIPLHVIDPDDVPAKDPMGMPGAKVPLASEISMTKVLPGSNAPLAVNGMSMDVPAHHTVVGSGPMSNWAIAPML